MIYFFSLSSLDSLPYGQFFSFLILYSRFWAITRPLRYRSLISKRRLFCCILIIWLCSAAISFIPIFSGWYHSQGPINIFTLEYVNECGLDVSVSVSLSLFLPLFKWISITIRKKWKKNSKLDPFQDNVYARICISTMFDILDLHEFSFINFRFFC